MPLNTHHIFATCNNFRFLIFHFWHTVAHLGVPGCAHISSNVRVWTIWCDAIRYNTIRQDNLHSASWSWACKGLGGKWRFYVALAWLASLLPTLAEGSSRLHDCQTVADNNNSRRENCKIVIVNSKFSMHLRFYLCVWHSICFAMWACRVLM